MKKRSRKQGVWRKTLGAGLVLVLVLGLCGCGARQDQGSASDSTFRIAKTWDKTGIRNHYHGGSAIGGLEWLAVEPLVQYVRSTDE